MTDENPRRPIRARLRRKLLSDAPRSASGAPRPSWDRGNLSRHFEKRVRLDRGCMEGMIEIEEGLQLAPGHYRERSEEAYATPSLIARYQKEESEGSGEQGKYIAPRVQFTDRELMTSITSEDRKKFITCYHWHFDRLACQGKPDSEAESGRQLQKVARRLRDRQKWKKIKDLTFLDS